MLNTADTTQRRPTVPAIECVIRVKGGNLASRGKGTLTIGTMSDGKIYLNATLPDASGVQEPFDLTSIERLEWVRTRSGIYQGEQWLKVVVGTAVGLIGIPTAAMVIGAAMGVGITPSTGWFPSITEWILLVIFGSVFGSCIYMGSQLNRIARFVAVTKDGRHCVAEMPEAALHFLQGIKAAENLYVAGSVSESTADVEGAAPTPA